ncbi:hypothetical protein [Roseisalinus antarcticus]|uniref:Invasion associated locus B (IalB) protein n=1 Tax=Roseisalinus antarcticus TaxID=254357 RepID=A0A1Y5TW75_9RHOB|nr:hypothetical protein [Roseisalinus antarcticus]SLN71757.1 hypothetical protein ROA7023_03542 [Roseisalinus antarcticus]
MPLRIAALSLALVLPVAALAEWRVSDDGAEVLGAGDFGMTIRMRCENGGVPSYTLTGLFVFGLQGEATATLLVDGRDFGPIGAACDGEAGCALTLGADEADNLAQALKAGAQVAVALDGETVETISLRGSGAAISALSGAGCDAL